MPKQAKKTETAVSTASEVAGPDMASIISLLEEHRVSSELAQREHRASISADFKAAFAVLEAKLNQTQTTVAEHGEQIDSLETNANLQDVIMRLHRYQVKDLIVREARKRRGDLRYRGTPVQIYEDFTQEVLEQRAKYRDIMSKLYNLGLRPALFPARLQITLGSGAKKRFPSPLEAVTFAAGYECEPAN
ncbi:hypothetical protein F7725_000315 [Dissostichus mawsoni]|uniref:Uncharacterized protein n=1 Tax=Dissostichus mawsoni TaxID=36200 RepID=A0A7J5ZEM3_DISMA|nr:hypothetical protein F7725_000315 [Dissostichus mawsoni]